MANPRTYVECRETVEKELQSASYFAPHRIRGQSAPNLSLTAHFMDNDWNLKSKCLQTAYFPEDHPGEVIALGLTETLASWGPSEEEQDYITTDGGTNVAKATSLNTWTPLQCSGLRLHSAVGMLVISSLYCQLKTNVLIIKHIINKNDRILSWSLKYSD